MRRPLLVTGLFSVVVIALTVVWADPPAFITDPLVQVSGLSPFATCTADDVPGQPGTVFLHSEVEPWIEVNPRNSLHLVGGWQQDALVLRAAAAFEEARPWADRRPAVD